MTDRQGYPLRALGIALVTGLVFFLYHGLTDNLLGVDAYFHLRFSAIMAEQGLVRDFVWLPFTIYAENFTDDHLLFHLLLIPFSDDLAGGQLYASLMAAAVFAVFYLLLAHHGIRWPSLWTLGLILSSSTFLFRLCLVRPPSLSLLFLLIGCWIILDGRDRWLAPLGLIYAWSYGGFPLLIVQAGVAAAAYAVYGQNRWRLLMWASLGCLAGVVLNPYFPQNLEFLWRSYTEIELGTFPPEVTAGNEDYPYASSTAVRKAILVWALTFAAILAYTIRPIQFTATSLFLFLFSIAMLCLYLLARRFIEYWPPFAVLFGAFALQHWWSAAPARWRSTLHSGMWLILPIVFAFSGHHVVTKMLDIREPGRPISLFKGAAGYLAKTAARGEIIFHSSWGDFPALFHLNPGHRYIAGLGLHYLYLHDAELHKTYKRVGNGDDKTPSQTIIDKFGARYAFSRGSRQDFIASMDADPNSERVYEDEHAIVFRLTSQH